MAADNRDDKDLPGSDPMPAEPEHREPAAPPEETVQRPPDDARASQTHAETRDRIPSDPWAETTQTRQDARPVPPDGSGPGRVAGGDTSILPPVASTLGEAGSSTAEPGTPRWTARAQVPTPEVEEEVHPEWAEPPRSPLVPILVAVCILLLVALVGLGIWLIFADRAATTPTPTPTVQTATPPVTSSTRATATTTTSVPPSPVPVPNLRGQDYNAAAAALTQLGFVPVRQDVVDADVQKGKVVGTDPAAGQQVRPGTRINVFVSSGPPRDTTPSPSDSPT